MILYPEKFNNNSLHEYLKGFSEETQNIFLKIISEYETASYSKIQKMGIMLNQELNKYQIEKEKKIKIAVIGSSTQNNIQPYLQFEFLRKGLICDIYIGDYNQARQIILNTQSGLYMFEPDIIFWHIELKCFISERALYSCEFSTDTLLNEIKALSECIITNCNSTLYLTEIVNPFLFYVHEKKSILENSICELNEKITDNYKNNSRVFVCPINKLAAYIGIKNVTDTRLYHLGKFFYSHEFCRILSKKIVSFAVSLTTPRIKCIVLDMDNTLWGGILGEDGPDMLKINDEYPGYYYKIFQAQLSELYRQGILLAINSKNNFETAIDMLRTDERMILKEKNFQVIKINWQEKIENMKEILSELNLSSSSILFIDDNPVECAKIKTVFSDIRTVQMPLVPEEIPAVLPEIFELNSLRLSDEDFKRNTFYESNKKRKDLKIASETLESFYKKLNIKVIFHKMVDDEIDRVHQLVNKTNQFNMTCERKTLNEIYDFAQCKSNSIFTVRVADCLSDYGLVGCIFIIENDSYLFIDNFIISCRALGLGVENAVFNSVIKNAYNKNINEIRIKFTATLKNKPASDFCLSYNMKIFQENKNDKIYFLKTCNYEIPKYITMLE